MWRLCFYLFYFTNRLLWISLSISWAWLVLIFLQWYFLRIMLWCFLLWPASRSFSFLEVEFLCICLTKWLLLGSGEVLVLRFSFLLLIIFNIIQLYKLNIKWMRKTWRAMIDAIVSLQPVSNLVYEGDKVINCLLNLDLSFFLNSLHR